MRRGTSSAKPTHADRSEVLSKMLRRMCIDASKSRKHHNKGRDTTTNSLQSLNDLYTKKSDTNEIRPRAQGHDQGQEKKGVQCETQEGDAQTPVSMTTTHTHTHSTDRTHVRARPEPDEQTKTKKNRSSSARATQECCVVRSRIHVFLSLYLLFSL